MMDLNVEDVQQTEFKSVELSELKTKFQEASYGQKRSRTVMTAGQCKVLKNVLAKTCFPSTELRLHLAKMLGMKPRTIQIWFQNQRQKAKTNSNARLAHSDEDKSTCSSSNSNSTTLTPLISNLALPMTPVASPLAPKISLPQKLPMQVAPMNLDVLAMVALYGKESEEITIPPLKHFDEPENIKLPSIKLFSLKNSIEPAFIPNHPHSAHSETDKRHLCI